MEISNLTRPLGWWRVDAEGRVHRHETATHALLAGGAMFSLCQLDTEAIAVFLDESPPDPVKARLAASAPPWLSAVVHAHVVSAAHDVVAVIDAAIGDGARVAPEACAFAAACVAHGAGTFQVTPEKYLVRLAGRGVVTVTLGVDLETERWSGHALEQP